MSTGSLGSKKFTNTKKVACAAALSLTLVLAGCADSNSGKAGVTSTGKPTVAPTASSSPTSTPADTSTPSAEPAAPSESPQNTPSATEGPSPEAEVPEPEIIAPEPEAEAPVDPNQSEGDTTNLITVQDREACNSLVSDINQYNYSNIYGLTDSTGEVQKASDRMEDRITTATASMENTNLISSLNFIASDLSVKVDNLIAGNSTLSEQTASAAVFEMSFANSQVSNTCAEQIN